MPDRSKIAKGLVAILLMVTSIISCKTGKAKIDQIPVATVLKKTLYLSDIKHIFPAGISKQDSLNLAQSFIENWIKTQLLLNKAEINLNEEQLNIADQLEAYRSSLLIYKYEEQMVREKIDTVVTTEEIEKYYNDNTSNFLLDDNLVKVMYIKMPLSAPDNEMLKKLYKSDQAEDVKKLEKYCYTYSNKYSYFNEDWISFANIQKLLPQAIVEEDNFLKENHFIEQQDKDFLYLVKINELKTRGSIAPLVYIKRNIKDVIINKRKVKFISDLEKNIYNDAADHSNFKIYKLDKK